MQKQSNQLSKTIMLLPLLAMPMLTAAQENLPSAASSFFGGLGLQVADKGYKGVGISASPIPALRFEYTAEELKTKRFFVRNAGAEYTLTAPQDQSFSLHLRAQPLLQSFDEDDGDIFKGMAKRDNSLLLGAAVRYGTSIGQLWANTGVDVIGSSKGMLSEVGLGWNIQTNQALGAWTLSPYLSAQHQNAKLVNYYYGVNSNEAIATRAAYQAGSAINLNAGINAFTYLTPTLMLQLGARYSHFGQSIRQSPLVDKSGGFTGSASLLYKFK